MRISKRQILLSLLLVFCLVILFYPKTMTQVLIPDTTPGITVSWNPADRALAYEVRINRQPYPQTQDCFQTLFRSQIPDSGEVVVYGFNGKYSPPSESVFYKIIPAGQYEPPPLQSGDIPLITTGENYTDKWKFVEPGIERINYYVYKDINTGIATKIMIGGNSIFNGSMYSYVTFQKSCQYKFTINWQPGTGKTLIFKCGNIERTFDFIVDKKIITEEFVLDIPAGTHRVSIKPEYPETTVYILFPLTIDFLGTLPPEKVEGVQISF